MTQIELITNDQKLMVLERPIIASGDKNSVQIKVHFDSNWEGFAKSATFFTEADRDTIYEVAVFDNMCTVPHEVLAEPGIIYIGVRGVKAETSAIKTSDLVSYRIKQGAPEGTDVATPPTPQVYQQLLDEVSEAVKSVNGIKPDGSGNVKISVSSGDGLTAAEKNLLLNLFRGALYTSNMSATITELANLWSGSGNEGDEGGGNEGGETPDIPVDPDTPEEPDIPEVTLTSISATYSGGDVEVGTDVSKLKGVTVIANYSDGTTASVSGYTLSGTIAEGANTITVHYKGLTATFAVTGFAVKETYTVTYNLTDVTADSAVSSVKEGDNLTVMLILPENHQLSNVTVTMGGVDVTSSVRNGNIITLTNVNGNIVITASSEEVQYVETFTFAPNTVAMYEDDGQTKIRDITRATNLYITPRIVVEPTVVHVKLTNNSTSKNGNYAAIGVLPQGADVPIPFGNKGLRYTKLLKTSEWAAGRSEEFDYTVPAGYYLAVLNGELDMELTGNIITRELENEYDFVTAVPSTNWALYTGTEATEETLLMNDKPTYMSATPFAEDTVVNIHVHNPTNESVEMVTSNTRFTLIAAYGDGQNAVGFNAIRTNSTYYVKTPLPSGRDMYDVEFTIPARNYLVTTVPLSCLFVKKIS